MNKKAVFFFLIKKFYLFFTLIAMDKPENIA